MYCYPNVPLFCDAALQRTISVRHFSYYVIHCVHILISSVIFATQIFANGGYSRKSAKIITCEKFYTYGTLFHSQQTNQDKAYTHDGWCLMLWACSTQSECVPHFSWFHYVGHKTTAVASYGLASSPYPSACASYYCTMISWRRLGPGRETRHSVQAVQELQT